MARIVLNDSAVKAFAAKAATPLVQSTLKAVTSQASDNAPGGPYSTGHLKQSMRWEMIPDNNGVSGVSGSDLIYAFSVHEGQPPRVIRAVNAPMLVFFWRRTGRVERFRKVNHPGTQGQPYLTTALLKVAPPRGFKVIIY